MPGLTLGSATHPERASCTERVISRLKVGKANSNKRATRNLVFQSRIIGQPEPLLVSAVIFTEEIDTSAKIKITGEAIRRNRDWASGSGHGVGLGGSQYSGR